MEIGRFLEIVCEHCSVYRKSDGPYRDRYEWVSHKNQDRPTSDDYLYQQWHMGGMTGGGYDGSFTNRYQSSGEIVGDLEDIDKILEAVAPNTSFIQYKRIVADVIKTGDFCRGGYYGDTSEYVYKACRIRDLYDALKERNLL